MPGTLCNYKQHAVNFGKSIAITMPNYPNYRLGPLDGSPCDTLGLNNIPLAAFRVRAESLTFFRSTPKVLSSFSQGKNAAQAKNGLVIFPRLKPWVMSE